jgi:hypothetical protein
MKTKSAWQKSPNLLLSNELRAIQKPEKSARPHEEACVLEVENAVFPEGPSWHEEIMKTGCQ